MLMLAQSSGPGLMPSAGAYVWQRQWSAPLSGAVRDHADLLHEWHVLAAEGDAATNADWALLAATRRPVIPVFRIDGRIGETASAALASHIVLRWRALPAVAHMSIEIDHDCATARLAGYAAFLVTLRAALPPRTQILITALPTWLAAADFPPVLRAVDSVILQVHAIEDPRLGLFDAGRAERWVRRLASLGSTPFLVSLPAYGARIIVGTSGGLLAAAAESAALDDIPGDEEMADPAAVAGFLDWLRSENFPASRGIVWFRLPTGQDRRAWSAATLRSVTAGAALHPHIAVQTEAGWRPGLRNLLLANDGSVDAMLPPSITLPPGCNAADGVGDYDFDGARLARRRPALLHTGERRLIGWQQCSAH